MPLLDPTNSPINFSNFLLHQELITKGEPWTKEMELSVTDKELVLLDCETQELIERYPLSHIDSVQDINDDPLLNSVLVFSTTQTPEKYAAVHLFQCDKIPVSCQDTSSNLKYSYPCCLLSSLVVYQLCRSLCYSCTEAIRWSKAHCVPQLSVS